MFFAAWVCSMVAAVPVWAATVPFTETFAAGHSNWADAASAPLSWSGAGGADGGYAYGALSFASLQAPSDVVAIRGAISAGASNGEVFGNWLADGVSDFTAYVRHDAAVPLTFFVRFAVPARFPGAFAVDFTPVAPNEWTLIHVPIDASNPQFVTFEGSTFANVFSDIGHIQLGVRVPEALVGSDVGVTFGIDSISLVPEPTTLCLLAAGGARIATRRRRGPRR